RTRAYTLLLPFALTLTSTSSRFPYTTLFRSHVGEHAKVADQAVKRVPERRGAVALDREMAEPREPVAEQRQQPEKDPALGRERPDRKSTRLKSSHQNTSYDILCHHKNIEYL